MNRTKNSKSNGVLKGRVPLAIFGTTFVTIIFDIKSLDPFNTPKLVALILISTLLIGEIIKTQRINPIKSTKVGITFFFLLTLFLASNLFSFYFSDSWIVALIGDTQRRNGLLAYFGLGIIALYTFKFISFKNILSLYRIAILTGLVFSFYGIIQITGHDFVSWNNPYNSVIGTVGNPNFASALMAILTVLAMSSLLIKELSIGFKLSALFCIAMSITAIVASNSRQGLVSLGFSIIFYVSCYIYLNRRSWAIAAVTVSSVTSILAIFGMLQKGPLSTLLYKPSVTVRGYYWDAALEMLKAYPLTGVGLDHYGYYFKEFRSVEYPIKYGFDLTSTNAHNTFLQMFATGGLFLGLGYLLLTISTLYVGLKLVKLSNSNERLVSLGILAAWLAFQAQSLISIDNIGVSVWGWLLTGAIFGLASIKELERKKLAFSDVKSSARNQIRIIPNLATGLIMLPVLILSVLLIRIENNAARARDVAQNLSNYRGVTDNLTRQLNLILDQHATYVVSNPMSDPNYKVQISYHLFNSGKQSESIDILGEIVKKFPRNIYAVEALAIQFTEQNNFNMAITYREKLALIDPWNGKNYLQLMLLYKSIGDLENATIVKNRILSFAPETNEAKVALEEFAK
jgi:O-antigen ligase